MPVIDYPLWKDIGEKLVEKYKKRYLTPEEYGFENLIEAFTIPPDIDEVFGTKVCNILIVSLPVGWRQDVADGWVEEWPPAGWDELVDRHKEVYSKFKEYNTFVWVDRYIETLISAAATNGESMFPEMMAAVSGHMQDVCSELAEFGWHWMGEIESAVEENYFFETIDAFYFPNRDQS